MLLATTLTSVILERFVSEVSQRVQRAVADFEDWLKSRGVSTIRLGKTLIANLGKTRMVVDLSLMDASMVDANTLDGVVIRHGEPTGIHYIAFAQTFAPSAYQTAKKKPYALFSIKTLTVCYPESVKTEEFVELLRQLSSAGVRFRRISDPSQLDEEAKLSLGVLTAITWLANKSPVINPLYAFRAILSELESDSFWNMEEAKMYEPLRTALSLVGFTVHERLGGEYADLYVISPAKLLIEVKNEKAGKQAVEQAHSYGKMGGAIDKYLKISIGGPWFTAVIAPEFSREACSYAPQKKVLLLDRESLVMLLRLHSVLPPSMTFLLDLIRSKQQPPRDAIRRALEAEQEKLKVARFLLNYLKANPRASRDTILSAISSALQVSRSLVEEVLNRMLGILPLVDEIRSSPNAPPIYLPSFFSPLHFYSLYEALSGGGEGEDVSVLDG